MDFMYTVAGFFAGGGMFMFPILAFAAFFVLRGVTQRSKDIAA